MERLHRFGCNFCQFKFSGGATRIRQHICEKCTSQNDTFCSLKDKMLGTTEVAVVNQQQKAAHKEVMQMVEVEEKKERQAKVYSQRTYSVKHNFGPGHRS